ncbi:MAG: deoxynucleoside kinase [Sphingobacteriales bacterium]|nr:deoxynucleoside kinase [Sphingobacteriales bacterium]
MLHHHFITVEGNTDAGKTSLARLLANDFRASLVLETFADNPFLADFYANRERYAFTTETYFLLDRFEQLSSIIAQTDNFNKGLTITDYLLQKTLLYAKVNLKFSEYKLLERLFYSLLPNLPNADLVIYVHASIPRLLKNIKERGRDFEQIIDPEYLKKVEDVYFSYFNTNPQLTTLILHADPLDFVKNSKHYEQIKYWITQTYPVGVHHLHFDQ